MKKQGWARTFKRVCTPLSVGARPAYALDWSRQNRELFYILGINIPLPLPLAIKGLVLLHGLSG